MGNYFPRMNIGLPIPAPTQESEVWYDKLHRSDMTVVLDLLVANGADIRGHHRKLDILSNSIDANESQDYL